MRSGSSDALPPGWQWVKIDNLLADLGGGRTLHHGWSPQCEKGPATSDDEWGVLKTTAIQPGSFLPEQNKRLPASLAARPQIEVHAGDFLITCAGPRSRCGIACLVKKVRPKLMLSGKMYRFRVREELVEPIFLEAYFQSSAAQVAIDRIKTGGNDSGLNLTHDRFKQLLIPVAPIAEQRRIVARVDELFSKLDAAEAALEQGQKLLRALRRSRLASMVSLNGQSWGGNADSWPLHRLADLGEVTGGLTKTHKRPANLPKVPFLRVANVYADELRLEEVHEIGVAPAELQRALLEDGDILVVEGNGSVDQIGRVALWDGSIKPCVHQNHLIKIRLHDPRLRRFLLLWMLSPTGRAEIVRVASSTSGLHTLSISKIQALTLRCPAPALAETIAAKVDEELEAVTAVEAEVARQLKTLPALRGSVLGAAFAGKLSEQDSGDGPVAAVVPNRALEVAATRRPGRPRRVSPTA